MSYARDRDTHHRGVGAIAAADHLRGRKVVRRANARATARRDAQLAGLTYGRTGGLSGYGALQALGAIKVTGSSMQSVRQPIINGGGIPEGPQPPPQRTFNPLRPNIGIVGPAFQPGGSVTAPPLRPVLLPPRFGAATQVAQFPVNTSIGPIDPNGGSSGGGVDAGGVLTTSGAATGGSAGAGGGGIVTGGSSGPTFDPPPDVPDAPPSSSGTIFGLSPLVAGGIALGALYLLTRKRS